MQVAEKFGLKEEDLELSMGMSGDYEEAVFINYVLMTIYKLKKGATIIRIGTAIFGKRVYPTKKKQKVERE